MYGAIRILIVHIRDICYYEAAIKGAKLGANPGWTKMAQIANQIVAASKNLN